MQNSGVRGVNENIRTEPIPVLGNWVIACDLLVKKKVGRGHKDVDEAVRLMLISASKVFSLIKPNSVRINCVEPSFYSPTKNDKYYPFVSILRTNKEGVSS